MRLFFYLGRGLVICVGVVGFCRLMFLGCFSLEGDRTAQQVNKFFDIAPSPPEYWRLHTSYICSQVRKMG